MTVKLPPAPLKIYSNKGDYLGCTVYAEDAAVLVASLGVGATIRNGHAKKHIVWHEGEEEQPAGESFDFVAEVVYSRMDRVPPGRFRS
jgi:hypothetical protein